MSGSVTTIPKRPGTTMDHGHAPMEYPADLLKFIAWPHAVGSFEEAVNMIKDKKPVLGEPIIVPFKYTHSDGSETVECVLGIGSLDEDNPFIRCSITNDILNEGVIKDVARDGDGNPAYDEEGKPIYTYTKLEDLIKDFIKRDDADRYISNTVNNMFADPDVINAIADSLVNSNKINTVINDRLSWKSISSLI